MKTENQKLLELMNRWTQSERKDAQMMCKIWQRRMTDILDPEKEMTDAHLENIERTVRTLLVLVHNAQSRIADKKNAAVRQLAADERQNKTIDVLLNGESQMKAIMNSVFSETTQNIRGFVMVHQWSMNHIMDGFNTFAEVADKLEPHHVRTYLPPDLKTRKADHGCALYEVQENGIMKLIDFNPDSSD